MHDHIAHIGVVPRDGNLVRIRKHDLACHGIAAVIVGGHRHAIAGL